MRVLRLDLCCFPVLSRLIVPRCVAVSSDPHDFTCHAEPLLRALSAFAELRKLSPPSWVALYRLAPEGKPLRERLEEAGVITAPRGDSNQSLSLMTRHVSPPDTARRGLSLPFQQICCPKKKNGGKKFSSTWCTGHVFSHFSLRFFFGTLPRW